MIAHIGHMKQISKLLCKAIAIVQGQNVRP